MKDSKALLDTIGLEEDFLGRSLLLLSPHGGYRGIQRHSRENIPPHSRRCYIWPLHLLFSLRFAELCHCTSTRSKEKVNKAEFCSGDCMWTDCDDGHGAAAQQDRGVLGLPLERPGAAGAGTAGLPAAAPALRKLCGRRLSLNLWLHGRVCTCHLISICSTVYMYLNIPISCKWTFFKRTFKIIHGQGDRFLGNCYRPDGSKSENLLCERKGHEGARTFTADNVPPNRRNIRQAGLAAFSFLTRAER